MKIHIPSLILTQEYIRSLTRILDVRYYISIGNSLDNSPVKVVDIPEADGFLLHDGLTRCFGSVLAGKEYLNESEFIFKKYTLDDYLTFNPYNGWYTPFNPLTHVRSYQFMECKKLIMAGTPYKELHHKYCRPREILRLSEII